MSHDLGQRPRGFQALLGADRWHALQVLGTLRSYRSGAFLLHQGDRGDFLLALASGRVRVLAATAGGSEVLLSFRGAGDLVGEMAVSSGVRTATVQAIDRCAAHYIARAPFQQFLVEHDAQGVFTDYLVSKLSETVPYQVQQVHFSPLQRLSRLLLELVALADSDQVDQMRIPLSQEALASSLGLARSTVAEQIAKLRRAGALAPGPRLVVADRSRLAENAGAIAVRDEYHS